MSNWFSKVLFSNVFVLGLALGSSVHAQNLYDYQTGQTVPTHYDQSGYDDQNYAIDKTQQNHFYSGEWTLTLGASVYHSPKYQGADRYDMSISPIFSIDKAGPGPRFSSLNDNMSFALLERNIFRMGLVGKILESRDSGTSDDLKGLKKVKWGGEIGGFAELYPLDWLRLRGELRQGIRSHKGVTLDLSADAFQDLTPKLRLSGGPRAFYATKDYFKTYYGVSAHESFRSGLREFHPDSGFESIGFGGALTWQTTSKITTSVFGEYSRLTGDAGDSSLVQQRGDKNQFSIGISATYDFNLSFN
ncbi:MipA/OmpV family protein [Bartonella tamiae]|uniref:Uncharacterized protein n=1 Tax=Bartonella tamiae Th239 TaxID=1094558 RepID=J0QWD6_9HYPH|nr:MipA/OmpV family protein [Bartonella tamiae]EJF90346.1 hypothetical protein ME5_00747 [Bartonella tamiae Th239]EJF93713.1 hypothetical protein MEG_01137 [Bartonella tamiae Th307]